MLTIAKIFGKSPFVPLQIHLEKIAACIHMLPSLLKAVSEKDEKKIKGIARKISKLEHEADLTKNDIRNHLPRSLFMPIDRSTFLEILALQDTFGDTAEDIAVLTTWKTLENYEEMKKEFEPFFHENIKTFDMVQEVIKEFDSLLESSFGGLEAKKVTNMIEKIAHKEYEIDCLQYDLMKHLYDIGENISYVSFDLWKTLIKEIGFLSNLSEKLANRIRMILEVK